VTFWIEGVHTEDLVEYWPEWIYLRNNEGYFDPKEVRRRTTRRMSRRIPFHVQG